MASESVVLTRFIPWITPATDADWNALYAEQLPRVYNYFRYRLGDGADAEDLTSITFEKAWRARHRYRRDLAAFSTWLLSIARNVAVDHHRQRRDHAPLEAADEVAGGETPEDIAARRSDADRLDRLMAQRPERERELLALKYGAGLTNRAIARLTGLSESNVGTLHHRTIQELRVAWGNEERHDG
jgi:RNA polymerase sigma-70 factor, ECF subfamily